MGFPHLPYPLINIQKAIEAMAIEIVDLPIGMVMFHGFLFTCTRPGSFAGRLMMPESEFRGHRHVLSRYPKGIGSRGWIKGSKDQRTVEASGKYWYPLYVSFGDFWWENK